MNERSAIVVLMTPLLACSGHHAPGTPDSCREGSLDPAEFRRLEGRWIVRHAEFERWQKPPDKRPIGELALQDCRYRFIPLPGVDLTDARDDLPFIDAPSGPIELAGPRGHEADGNSRALAVLRLDTGPSDAERPSIWEVDVLARVQEGEYLYFSPVTPVEVLRWSVSRGAFRLRPDEYIPSSDPDTRAPSELQRRLRSP